MKATASQFDHMARPALKTTCPQALVNLARTAELYPHSFSMSGAVGNEKQYSKFLEFK